MDALYDRGQEAFCYIVSLFRQKVDATNHKNYCITSAILITVSLIQLHTKPIECWCPEVYCNWKDAPDPLDPNDDNKHYWYIDYLNAFCLANSSYHYKWQRDTYTRRASAGVNYYAWTPLFLCLQALLFAVMYPLEMYCHHRSTLSLRTAVTTAKEMKHSPFIEKEQKQNYFVLRMHRFLKYVERDCCSSVIDILYRKKIKQNSNFNTTIFFSMKVVHLVNCVFQFAIMCLFLGQKHNPLFAIDLVKSFMKDEFDYVGLMPLTTMCDVPIRRLGNLHVYPTMCVLPQNLYNRGIFVFLSCWYVALAVLNVYSLLVWTANMSWFKDSFIRHYLSYPCRQHECGCDSPSVKDCREFTRYLASDGVLVFRLVNANAGSLTTRDLMHNLFVMYKREA